MAKRLTDIQKDAEASKEALSHQLLEFQSSAQENHNVIHAQLSELVDYIHRGSADKKGESGSRGLQKPANTQKEGSAVTPTFEQRVQMAQRRIVQTVLNADANRESQDAAERDRERRRKEASVFLLRIGKRQRFDKLERRRGVHCFVSADEVFSRYLVEEFSSWLSLFVGDCDTTAFGLVGTTAFCLIQQKRSFDNPADALLGVYQQMYFKDSKTASLE
ncbi:hypothetical protein F511_19810 [Dorcoceras hygrometricum]|uniref:Uncharacterized protein n=1 Tax=Dorcoceras hygrometricum TaxID=472368 RepID=A0A2Z7AWY0_9LAMI|nr:hypothetical protein F511_19810 [Dorcoceras hygrometricum]